MAIDDFPAVLEAARRGEADALEAVYRDLAPAVTGYLRGHGTSEPDDLVSEVFVAVVRNLGRFEGDEAAFRSWVFTIAHRRLIDEHRRRARRPEDATDPAELHAAGVVAPGADQDALARLDGAHLLGLLDRLTSEQRSVLLLRVVADLPVDEVARVMGKRPGAVKTLQRRALARLRALLAERGERRDS